MIKHVFDQTCAINMKIYFETQLACGSGRQVADIKQIYNLYLQTLIHCDEILIALSP